MNYKTSEIAKISGVSARTLRYYDEINLLKPNSVDINGYRVYTKLEIDKLQLILFYREIGMPLEEIKSILSKDDFDIDTALNNHLKTLIDKKFALERMISTLTNTIKSKKEGIKMEDTKKFENLETIAQNESKYGEELKEKYGEDIVNKSFEKARNIGIEDIKKATDILNTSLITAFKTNNPASSESSIACENHKNLLLLTWPDGLYSKENHLNLVESFLEDERFTSYYENLETGLMNFLYEATKIFCK